MQKSKIIVCDRPFTCPVCKRDYVAGDEIFIMIPQRTRYCLDCGEKKLSGMQSAAPKSATTGQPPATSAALENRLTLIEADLKIALDRPDAPKEINFDVGLELTELREAQHRLSARLTTLENQFKHTIGAKISP